MKWMLLQHDAGGGRETTMRWPCAHKIFLNQCGDHSSLTTTHVCKPLFSQPANL